MKKAFLALFLLSALLLTGCTSPVQPAQIAATTLPVYELTARLCTGTPLTVTRLVTEEVSCLHDYSLNVNQVKAAEAAELIVISGAGLEEFLDDMLVSARTVDASHGIDLIVPEEHSHEHDHEAASAEEDTHDHLEEAAEHEVHGHEEELLEHGDHDHGDKTEHDGHHHEQDPHIWLSPVNAAVMAQNICLGLEECYPEYAGTFSENLTLLQEELFALQEYGETALSQLSCREIITFHDGFAYLTQAFHLTILDAIEEESGSEASAKELIHMIEEVEHHNLPAIFTEKSGSVSAAGIIARETGAKEYTLDMAMAGNSYFEAMYHNIDTLKEALQ